jgi:hypothetical protein
MLRSRCRSLHSRATLELESTVPPVGALGVSGGTVQMPPTRDGDPISLPAAHDTFVTRVLLDKRTRSAERLAGELLQIGPSKSRLVAATSFGLPDCLPCAFLTVSTSRVR